MSSTTNNNTTTNNNNSVEHSDPAPFKRNGRKFKKVVVHIKRVATSSTSIPEEPLQVHVKTFGKAQQIKKKIKKQTGVPIFRQVLILAGRKVDNNERIVQLLSNTKELELTMFLVIDKAVPKPENCLSSKSTIDSGSEVTSQQQQQHQEEAELLCGSNDTRSTSSCLGIDNDDNNHSIPEIEITPEVLVANRDAPVLKISYEDQHRRIPFEGHSFQRLTSLCTLFFGVKNTRRMLFQYKDEDGDLVQISTDAELAYALQFYATNTSPRVLRLQFSLRQCKYKRGSPEDNQSSPDLSTPNNVDINHERVLTTRALPMKKLQEGDVIQLSNRGLHLVLSSNNSQEEREEDEVVADAEEEKQSKRKFKKMKPQFEVSASSDDSEASHWIVEKALPKKKKKNDNKDEGVNIGSQKDDEEIIFLKNKKKSAIDDSHLRVNPTGERVVHKSIGGTGLWARFCVEYVASSGCIRLRSVGRSHLKNADAATNAFLGIVQEASKSDASHVVRANLNKDDKRALFNVRFI